MFKVFEQMISFQRNIEVQSFQKLRILVEAQQCRQWKSLIKAPFIKPLNYGHALRHLSPKHRKIISKTAFPVLIPRLFKTKSRHYTAC